MTFLNRFILTSSILLFATHSLSAQTLDLTLEQALEQTFARNKQIEIDKHAQDVELFNRKAAKGLRSPQFGLSGAYTHLGSDIHLDLNALKLPIGGLIAANPSLAIPPQIGALIKADWGLTLQDKDFAFVGATVKMPIFTGGKINAANRAAKAMLELSKEQGNNNKNTLYRELIEQYYGVSLAMQAVEVRKEVLSGMALHLNDAIKLEEQGIIAKVERLYAQMKYAEAVTELKKTEATLTTITTVLKNTLNEPSTTNNIIPLTSMFILNSIENVSYFKELALKNNIALKQVDLNKKLATEAFKIKRAEFMPHLSAMGAYNIHDYQLTPIAPRWAVGVGLSFNIFDGLHRENKVRSAKSKIKQVEAIKDKASTDIQTLVEKLYNELSTTKNVFDSYASTIEFSEEYLRTKNIAFSNGIATSKDVIDAQLLLSKSKIEQLQSAFKYNVALVMMLENCGVSHLFLTYKNSNNFIPVYFIKYEK